MTRRETINLTIRWDPKALEDGTIAVDFFESFGNQTPDGCVRYIVPEVSSVEPLVAEFVRMRRVQIQQATNILISNLKRSRCPDA